MHSETPPRDKQGNTSSSIILPRFVWLSQNDTLHLITRGKQLVLLSQSLDVYGEEIERNTEIQGEKKN